METVVCALFSPDAMSSYLAVVDGTSKCTIYGTESYESIQEISCGMNCTLISLAFDPSGTILAIGGRTGSAQSEGDGVLLIVRVGELLRLEWFCRGDKIFADPARLCKKISSLTAVERAQILFHRADDTDEEVNRGRLPLERKIRDAIAAKRKEGVTVLGSTIMNTEPPFDLLMECLKAILTKFPQSVFVGAPGYGGDMFSVLLERDNPRLLKLMFYVALVTCRSYPYLAMSEQMRNGTLTRSLIASCNPFPDGKTYFTFSNSKCIR